MTGWLLVAIAAQMILGTSSVFDKMFLKRSVIDPISYTFWLGALGAFSFILAPFGFKIISGVLAVKAFFSGAVFIFAMLFLFTALKRSEASEVLPIIGGLTPVFTLLLSYFVLSSPLGWTDLAAFFLLVSGSLFLYMVEKKRTRLRIFMLTALSAIFFAVSTVGAKIVYNETSFINGFIWIKLGGAFLIVLFLLRQSVREKVFSSTREVRPRVEVLYFANRVYVGVGSLLYSFAISLAHPALVEATGGFKYLVIFLGSWSLLKEKFTGRAFVWKMVSVILIVAGILFLALGNNISFLS